MRVHPDELGVSSVVWDESEKSDTPNMALTDAKIRNLKPKDRPYKIADFDGLYIHVTLKG